MYPSSRLLVLSLLASHVTAVTLQDVVAQWSVNSANYTFAMPSKTMSSDGQSANYIVDNWGLSQGKISWGREDMSFVQDPAANNTSNTNSTSNARRALAGTPSTASSSSGSSPTSSLSPSSTASSSSSSSSGSASGSGSSSDIVLKIEYPQGSYSNATGGTQFNAYPISGTYERMLLAYDIYFSSPYQWVQGGKLPGLRGGPDVFGCSGGSETDGTGCFSTRLMWRTNGAGEVYAYIPTGSIKNFCSETGVTCNSDYGTSLDRGSFTWVAGQWQTIWMVVILNEVGTANGVVELYYNGVQAISFQNLELRSADSLAGINGMFFSTFFGGSDSSWATPDEQFTYFRNMQLFAGNGSATGSGQKLGSAGKSIQRSPVGWTIACLLSIVIGSIL